MSKEQGKVIKIMSELVRVFFKMGIDDLKVDVRTNALESTVELEGDVSRIPVARIVHLKEAIHGARQLELEEYWNLAGGNKHSELDLVGALVDEAEVEHDGDTLRVKVTRKA
ncbi:hypothetical protein [Acidaminobacter hydrogenoformans]|uniref:Uncharacterized protein n=1 Tax=Acidaminobacter hydrogenoformans DSM 2784 TaxID=1120920 RepID=A0A1G5RY61_9FIRM|nr:hypothetical protein [Acidaminobacter hydrogenoformans]SCZ78993.1 hypothetical protein SAMN03080599_01516 [Acidaminobacter hydrogenoformans DSM 2784]